MRLIIQGLPHDFKNIPEIRVRRPKVQKLDIKKLKPIELFK
jgi:hypothetical protein